MKSPLSGPVEAAVLDALRPERATGVDSPAVAGALARLYDELAGQLGPIVGTAGVRAVYGRSVHLAAADVPWIAAASRVPDGARPAEALRACLEQQDATTATDGARILLVAFVEVLARLIGEGLTTRLMAQAWPHAFPDDAGEKGTR